MNRPLAVRKDHQLWMTLVALLVIAFFVLAIMLSLLLFIGEAVRDAFDPRKVFSSDGPGR